MALDRADFGGSLADAIGDFQQDAPALARRHVRPRPLVERLAGGGDGAVDILGAGLGDAGERLAGRRVVTIEGLATRGVDHLSADQQFVVVELRLSDHTSPSLPPAGGSPRGDVSIRSFYQ